MHNLHKFDHFVEKNDRTFVLFMVRFPNTCPYSHLLVKKLEIGLVGFGIHNVKTNN